MSSASRAGASAGGTYDPQYLTRDGDGHRRCSNPCSLCLFVAMWVGITAVAVVLFTQGNPWRAAYGYDSYGNTCGTSPTQCPGPARRRPDIGRGRFERPPSLFSSD